MMKYNINTKTMVFCVRFANIAYKFIQLFNPCVFDECLSWSHVWTFPFVVVMLTLKNFSMTEHFQLQIFRLRMLNRYCLEWQHMGPICYTVTERQGSCCFSHFRRVLLIRQMWVFFDTSLNLHGLCRPPCHTVSGHAISLLIPWTDDSFPLPPQHGFRPSVRFMKELKIDVGLSRGWGWEGVSKHWRALWGLCMQEQTATVRSCAPEDGSTPQSAM